MSRAAVDGVGCSGAPPRRRVVRHERLAADNAHDKQHDRGDAVATRRVHGGRHRSPHRCTDCDVRSRKQPSDHGQRIAELPGLDWICDFRFEWLTAIYPFQLDTGMVADGVLALGAFGPLVASRRVS